MRRSLPLLFTFLILAACGDLATEAPLSPADAELARAGGFNTVLVKPGMPAQATSAGAPVVSTIADAVDRVAAGGTIKVFAGTYVTADVVIDKAVTLESAGNGQAVIRSENVTAALRVAGGGSLTVRGLEFENSGSRASILVTDAPAAVDVSDAAFRVTDNGFSGIDFRQRASGTALSVERSSFEGGSYGVIAMVAGAEVRESAFSGQRWVSLYLATDATVENNVMTDCGDNACIFAVGGSSGAIAGNTLSNARTGPGPHDEGQGIPTYAFFHHVILVFTGSDVEITGNEIDGCGWGQCIATGVGAHALIEDNVITAYQAQGTRIGIVVGDGAGGDAPAGNGSSAVVRNNQLIGVSANTDRSDPNQYAYRVSGFQAEGIGSSLVAEGNLISNAALGIGARMAASVSGSGNAADLLRLATAIRDTDSEMTLHGSDFTDYLEAIQAGGSTSSSLTCNYWGSAGGPSGVGLSSGQTSALYTPWAETPIAATGQTTGCTGGL